MRSFLMTCGTVIFLVCPLAGSCRKKPRKAAPLSCQKLLERNRRCMDDLEEAFIEALGRRRGKVAVDSLEDVMRRLVRANMLKADFVDRCEKLVENAAERLRLERCVRLRRCPRYSSCMAAAVFDALGFELKNSPPGGSLPGGSPKNEMTGNGGSSPRNETIRDGGSGPVTR